MARMTADQSALAGHHRYTEYTLLDQPHCLPSSSPVFSPMGDLLLYSSASPHPVSVSLEMLARRSPLVRELVSPPADHRLLHLGHATACRTLVLADTQGRREVLRP